MLARLVGIKTYALLHEDAELALIFNIDELLAAVSRVGAAFQLIVSNGSKCPS